MDILQPEILVTNILGRIFYWDNSFVTDVKSLSRKMEHIVKQILENLVSL